MADLAALRRPPALRISTSLSALPPATRFIVRGGAEVIVAAGAAMGFSIDQSVCRASQLGARAALWLGPDEYLLLALEADAVTLGNALHEGLNALPHSLVDVSHRQTGLEIRGARAADLLNCGCPLDLDLAAFPVGMCTRTVLAKADIILWRTAPDVFRLEVWRSFSAYAASYLAEAARDLEES